VCTHYLEGSLVKINTENILITAYRRPESLKRLINSQFVREAKNVVVGLDGPNGAPGDAATRKEVYEVINASKLNSTPIVFEASSHLGLYEAMRRNLDFAFSLYSNLTILEEDCVPSDSTAEYLNFIRANLSNKYKNYHVCLSRHIPRSIFRKSQNVSFTKYPFVWGWNANEEVWLRSRGLVSEIDPNAFSNKMGINPSWNPKIEKFWLVMLEACKDIENARTNGTLEQLDLSIGLRRWAHKSWATPYTINYWMNSEEVLAIRPPVNLIENIGFGATATHTLKRPAHAMKLRKLKLEKVTLNENFINEFDLIEDKLVFNIG